MILIGTHGKLVARKADIFRVDYVGFEFKGTVIPASHEHYATMAQAAVAAGRWGDLDRGTISRVPATAFDPWHDR